jgi:YidC/Oxa1 family membrane protein insertase
MDRQSIIGFVLIFIVLIVWVWLNSSQQKPKKPEPIVKTEQIKDTSKAIPSKPHVLVDSQKINPYGKFFAEKGKGKERIIPVETDLYYAELSTRGGVLRKWQLKEFKTWDGYPVELVNSNDGDLTILLTTSDGKVINTKDLYFDVKMASDHVRLEGNFEFEINFILAASNGGTLQKKLKFRNDEYGFDVEIRMMNMGSVIANYQYELEWENGIRYAEENSVDESSFAASYAFAANELTEIDASNTDQKEQKEFSGSIDWIATRNKYFAIALMPMSNKSEGAYLEGIRNKIKDEGLTEVYDIALKMPFTSRENEIDTFKVFLGPLQHSTLKSYDNGLENIMSLGWVWLIRPISEYFMLPVFTWIHYVIPNWGMVIIIFTIIIKLLLHPLSKSQMKSMKKMQKLQPLMQELKEKYKDDPQKMNQSIMNLYKEYGVNPAGGCLPLIVQLPIMYALYSVFRGAIELRQASFVGWITDLSVPDVIYRLPSRFLGVQNISGIAVLMGITMFISQKMTVKDPRQKAMLWMMPIMMTFLFNGFPSGLNLYYAVFNILAIVQQMLINRHDDDEPLRKVEKQKKGRGGIFKFAKDMPRLKK